MVKTMAKTALAVAAAGLSRTRRGVLARIGASLRPESKGRSMARGIVNILGHLFDSKLRPVMVQKIGRRLLRYVDKRERGAAQWAKAQATDHAELCRTLDAALWAETVEYVRRFRREADEKLARIPTLGGAGNYHVLYFMTRWLGPKRVLETGVAAGFSTHAILTALEKNGSGHLWSSDFPYFRLDNPEKYVGVLVAENLRPRWTLSLEGDTVSVPRFLEEMGGVDLFHYDSDKTYAGRTETILRVLPRLAADALAIVDDIQDNDHFRDLMKATPALRSRVFGFEGKFCGLFENGGAGRVLGKTGGSGGA
jgi:predicted O-methyltransferase YrrM